MTSVRKISSSVWPHLLDRCGPDIEQAVVSRDAETVRIDPLHSAWREGVRRQIETLRQQAFTPAETPQPHPPVIRTIVKHELYPDQRHITDKLTAMAKRDAYRVKQVGWVKRSSPTTTGP